jgi:erythronate-4-phosphate dehydrogenase
MKIVADANIVDVAQLYRSHGELVLLPGRSISAADVADADALLVRSVTRVDAALLQDSRVRFVATATSGTDHIGHEFIGRAGIHLSTAAGCNANAVVEYCLASMAELIGRGQFSLQGQPAAIIGFGHVGRRLYKALMNLGVSCVVCDPFVEESPTPADAQVTFCDLEQALQASIISLHTPLSTTGPFPTHHLLDQARIDALTPGTLLINAARGEVLDNAALEQRLRRHKDLLTVLDVWENEPDISLALLQQVDIATPHIAGYSVEAKRAASASNYQAFLKFFDLVDSAAAGSIEESIEEPLQTLSLQGVTGYAPNLTQEQFYALCLRAAFPVANIDRQLRAGQGGVMVFDSLRLALSARREFAHYVLDPQDLAQISPCDQNSAFCRNRSILPMACCRTSLVGKKTMRK